MTLMMVLMMILMMVLVIMLMINDDDVGDDVDDDLLSGCINLARTTRDDKMVPHQSNHPVLKMIIIKKSTTLIIQ